MLQKLDSLYLNAKTKAKDGLEVLKTKHPGFSGIIVAIALIVIAIIVVVYFKSQTQPAVEGAIDATKTHLNTITTELSGTTTPPVTP